MYRTERSARPRLALSLGLLAAMWLGPVAHAQQIPTFGGSGQRPMPSAPAPGMGADGTPRRGFLATRPAGDGPANSAEPRRMGVLEYRTQPAAPSEGYVVVVGGVRQNLVVRTRRSEVSLDALIDRAGGLAPDATGAIQIFRDGRPRIHVLYVPGSGANILPGDTVIVAARPVAKPAAPDAPPPQESIVSIVCHNILPRPVIIRLPESAATAEVIFRGFGQDIDAKPSPLPPQNVVLPAAQPRISKWTLLPTGTSLYFDPQNLNRLTLDTLLATRLRFEEAVDLEKTTAALEASPLPAPPARLPLAASPATPAPLTTAAPLAMPAMPAPPALDVLRPEPLLRPVDPAPTALAPPLTPRHVEASTEEPGRMDSSDQRVEVVHDASAVAASLERVIPEKAASGSLVPPTELSTSGETTATKTSVNQDALVRGLVAGGVIGLLAGLYAWLRTQWSAGEPRKVATSAADLPVVEEPPQVRAQPLHGRVVADRRLAFDPPHETLAGPHFDARPKTRPPVVRTSSARTESARGESTPRAAAAAPPSASVAPVRAPEATKAPATGGLLDRILIAMQRERSQ